MSKLSGMNLVQAIVLGVIEGITEFLPVSSTGHLVVAQKLMGIGVTPEDAMAADAFAVCIQIGAILAVLGIYWGRIRAMVMGLLGRDAEGLKMLVAVVVGFLPAMVIGVLCNDWIEEKLFGMMPILVAWFVGGVAILWFGKKAKSSGEEEDLSRCDVTWKMALMIGLFQCVAMWPGTSRSLVTILGGLAVGLSMRKSVEYSFLLGLLTLTAATVKKAVWKVHGLEAYDHWMGGLHLMVAKFGWLNLSLGLLASAISAVIAVKWMLGYLQKHGLGVFGWYRIGLAVLVFVLMSTGVLQVAGS